MSKYTVEIVNTGPNNDCPTIRVTNTENGNTVKVSVDVDFVVRIVGDDALVGLNLLTEGDYV